MGKFGVGKTSLCKFYLMFNEGGRFFNFTAIKYNDNTWFYYIYLGGKRWVNY